MRLPEFEELQVGLQLARHSCEEKRMCKTRYVLIFKQRLCQTNSQTTVNYTHAHIQQCSKKGLLIARYTNNALKMTQPYANDYSFTILCK
jgi:hypothetical protein